MHSLTFKKCSKCKKDVEIRAFGVNKKGLINSWCNNCKHDYYKIYISTRKEEKRIKDKEYQERNRDKILAQKRYYYRKNKLAFKEKSKISRTINKDKISKQRKMFRERNKDKIRKQKRTYYIKNKDKIIKKSVIYRKKLRENPSFRILDSCRVRIREFIKTLNKRKRQKAIKLDSTLNLIGCSELELKNYLESKFKPGMTWDNYGVNGWNIDHIRPCASFTDFNKIETQKECFNYKNLQPLWADENRYKSSKYTP